MSVKDSKRIMISMLNELPKGILFDTPRFERMWTSAYHKKYMRWFQYVLTDLCHLSNVRFCPDCEKYKFVYEFRLAHNSPDGLRKHCSRCIYNRRSEVTVRINTASARFNDENFDPREFREDIERKLVKQNYSCCYTMVPFSRGNARHPFAMSIERIDRTIQRYSDTKNTVLTLKILNVGGRLNWTSKLTLQILFPELVTVRTLSNYSRQSQESFLKSVLSRCRDSCKTRNKRRFLENHVMELTVGQLREMLRKQKGRCYFTNLPLVLSSSHEFSLSVDRIDNSIGYVQSNIRLVISRMNLSSQTWTDELYKDFHEHLMRNKENILRGAGFSMCEIGSRRLRYFLRAISTKST